MKTTIALFSLFCGVLFLSPSCSKYPSGPKFTLITKNNRLVNDWMLTSYMINGNEFIQTQADTKLVMDKDGTYSMSSSQTSLGQIQSTFSHGTWTLSEDKSSLEVLLEGEEFPSSYKILDLRSKKMVLQYYDKTTNITYVSTYETDK